MMGNRVLLIMIALLTFVLPALTVPAQEKGVAPINRYVRNEGAFDDFVVEFLIPANSQWRIAASGVRARGVLKRSSTEKRNEGSHDRIILTSGFRARKMSGFMGNIDHWANSLTLYYRRG